MAGPGCHHSIAGTTIVKKVGAARDQFLLENMDPAIQPALQNQQLLELSAHCRLSASQGSEKKGLAGYSGPARSLCFTVLPHGYLDIPASLRDRLFTNAHPAGGHPAESAHPCAHEYQPW